MDPLLRMYLEAEMPRAWSCAGIPLQPFTLGHKKLLHAVRSRFVEGDDAPKLGDLALAVVICQRPFPEAMALYRSDLQCAAHVKAQAARWKRWGALDELQAVIAFQHYLTHFCTGPQWDAETQTSSETAGAPMVAQLTQVMLSLGFSLTEAEATPVNQALWHYAVKFEMEGRLRIVVRSREESLTDACARLFPGRRLTTVKELQALRQQQVAIRHMKPGTTVRLNLPHVKKGAS